MSVADELRKLADLKKEGLLTEEEFETQKERLLAGELPRADPKEGAQSEAPDCEHRGGVGANESDKESEGLGLAGKVVAGLVIAVIAFLGFGYASSENSRKKAQEMGHSVTEHDAYELCELTIKMLSKNSNTAKVSRVHGYLRDDVYHFKWYPHELQLQNGFGAMIGTSGDCSVNAVTGKLDNLSLK